MSQNTFQFKAQFSTAVGIETKKYGDDYTDPGAAGNTDNEYHPQTDKEYGPLLALAGDGDGKGTGRNYFGDVYTGPYNPVGYETPPNNRRDVKSMIHDKKYDLLGIKGANGLFKSQKALPADNIFIKGQVKLGGSMLLEGISTPYTNPMSGYNIIEGFKTFGIGVGMFIYTVPKRLFIIP